MADSEEEKPVMHYFTCLPYINLGSIPEIDLGFAKVWNFGLLKDKYISNKALREHVTVILKNYRGSYPHGSMEGYDAYPSIHDIGIISTEIPSDQEPDRDQKQKINDARLILFISFLARNNTITRNPNSGHGMASSENYAPVYFSAVADSKYVTEYNGFVVPSWHGGIEVDKNILIRPKHVSRPNFNVDGDLLAMLLRLRLKHKKAFRRIMSAIEVFYESYYNSPEVSHNARILLQASAFEILLDTGTGGGRQKLKALLKREATYPDDKQISFKSERTNHVVVVETGTIREKWADRFFSLRNHITHGHLPKEKEYYFGKWQRHFDIALYFFIFCLKRKLEEIFKKEIFGDDVMWKKWTEDLELPPKTYVGFEYEQRGRRSWERMMAKLKKRGKI